MIRHVLLKMLAYFNRHSGIEVETLLWDTHASFQEALFLQYFLALV